MPTGWQLSPDDTYTKRLPSKYIRPNTLPRNEAASAGWQLGVVEGEITRRTGAWKCKKWGACKYDFAGTAARLASTTLETSETQMCVTRSATLLFSLPLIRGTLVPTLFAVYSKTLEYSVAPTRKVHLKSNAGSRRVSRIRFPRARARSRTNLVIVCRRSGVYVTIVPLLKGINAHHAMLICFRLPGHAGYLGGF